MLLACWLLITVACSSAATLDDEEPILSLSKDSSFHFQLLGGLGEAIYGGADIGPILGVAKKIQPGNFTSFSQEFYDLAISTTNQVKSLDTVHDHVNLRETWFSIATYFRMADFYLHGNWSNPLISSLWKEQTKAFDKAIAALPIPGERVQIPSPKGNFTVEAIWYASSEGRHHRRSPTLIIGNGYDAAQEDSYHTYVVPALARGWNCITYEGPGQPTVRRSQDIGFIPNWEHVVTPVIDYLYAKKHSQVDKKRLVLLGNSFGGYLAARAAAFESRISALVLDGGIWDVSQSFLANLPVNLLDLYKQGNQTKFDNAIAAMLQHVEHVPTALRWGIDQGLWSFHTHSPFEFLTLVKQYTLQGIIDNIKIPVWIADAELEDFFAGQSAKVKKALGSKATLYTFKGVAGYHCQLGAAQELARTMFAWLNTTLNVGIAAA